MLANLACLGIGGAVVTASAGLAAMHLAGGVVMSDRGLCVRAGAIYGGGLAVALMLAATRMTW